MRHSLRLVVPMLLAGACDDGSGFAGDYEATELAQQQGACGGTKVTEAVPPRDQWFQLADEDDLVTYRECDAQLDCSAQYDLARSFGAGKTGDGDWAGYVSSAIPGASCTLTYRVRRLARGDDGRLEIATQVFRELDATLPGAACNDMVASERGRAMPCVEDGLLVAEGR